MKKNSEKALVDRIKNFQKSDKANKKCADCIEVGPTYVNVTHGTFVCTTCSGVHREFSHKIKGISMSKWTMEEVEDLEEGGNEKAAAKWLERWDSRDFPEPDSQDQGKVRDFIRQKYIDKRWMGRSTGADRERDRREADRDRETDRDRKDTGRARDDEGSYRRESDRDHERDRDGDRRRRDDRDDFDTRDNYGDRDRRERGDRDRDRDRDGGRDQDRRRDRDRDDNWRSDDYDRRDRRGGRDDDRGGRDRDKDRRDREDDYDRYERDDRGGRDRRDHDARYDRDDRGGRDRRDHDHRDGDRRRPSKDAHRDDDFFPGGNGLGGAVGGAAAAAGWGDFDPDPPKPAPAAAPATNSFAPQTAVAPKAPGLFDLDPNGFDPFAGAPAAPTAAPAAAVPPTVAAPLAGSYQDPFAGGAAAPPAMPAPSTSPKNFTALDSLGDGNTASVGMAMPGGQMPGGPMPGQMLGANMMANNMPGVGPMGAAGIPMLTLQQLQQLPPQQLGQMQMALQTQLQLVMQVMQLQAHMGQAPPAQPGMHGMGVPVPGMAPEPTQQVHAPGVPGTPGSPQFNDLISAFHQHNAPTGAPAPAAMPGPPCGGGNPFDFA